MLQFTSHGVARCGESNPLVRLEPCLCMVLWQMVLSHVWLGSIRPRSQCVGGMLPVQWCYKHVLELSQQFTSRRRSRSTCAPRPSSAGWSCSPTAARPARSRRTAASATGGRGSEAGEEPPGARLARLGAAFQQPRVALLRQPACARRARRTSRRRPARKSAV